MAHSYSTLKRLKKALKFRNLEPERLNVSTLCNELMRRGNTDRQVDNVLFGITSLLEPQPCHMTHCKHYGGVSCFCGCAKDWVPGRCSIYRKYNKRKKDKNKKIFDALTKEEQQVLRFTVNNSEITEKDNPGAFVKAMKTLMKKGLLHSWKPGEYNVRGKGREVILLGTPKEKK